MQLTYEEARKRKRVYKVTSFACVDEDYRKQIKDRVWAYYSNRQEAIDEARKHVGEEHYESLGVWYCVKIPNMQLPKLKKQLYKWNKKEGEMFYD